MKLMNIVIIDHARDRWDTVPLGKGTWRQQIAHSIIPWTTEAKTPRTITGAGSELTSSKAKQIQIHQRVQDQTPFEEA